MGDGADEVSGIHAVREAQVDLAGVIEGLCLVWGELQVQRETKMRRHRHEEVFVKIHEQGWAVSKPKAERASGVYDTQAQAIQRAQELAGDGTIHVQGRHGSFRKLTTFEEE